MKKFLLELLICGVILGISYFGNMQPANAGWVNGYFRSDGTWVNGYYRTEPNYYKWDNLSWNGDWNNALNDKSWYRDFGYDPEPWDNEIPNYSYWDYTPTYSYDNYVPAWDYIENDYYDAIKNFYNDYYKNLYYYNTINYNGYDYDVSWDWDY